MTTLRKLFNISKKKSYELTNKLLDFDLKKLLILKRLFILLFLTFFTIAFIFYSILLPPIIFKNDAAGLTYPLLCYFFLAWPAYYLLKKVKYNFSKLKAEYKIIK